MARLRNSVNEESFVTFSGHSSREKHLKHTFPSHLAAVERQTSRDGGRGTDQKTRTTTKTMKNLTTKNEADEAINKNGDKHAKSIKTFFFF